MKKILLATSILSGFAGMASAEITLSGDARMGITNAAGAERWYTQSNITTFNSRVRATITMSGETDSGLSFGGSFGVHNASDAASGKSGSVYISGAFGKIAMGDVDTAAQALVGQVSGVGYTGNGDWNELTYAGHSAEALLWTYSMGDLTVAASFGQQAVYEEIDDFTYDSDDDSYAVAASYKFGNYTVSAGYESGNKAVGFWGDKEDYYESSAYSSAWEQALLNETATIGMDAAFGNITVKARIGTVKGGSWGDRYSVEGSQGAVSASYTMDALTVTGFYNEAFVDFYNSYTYRGNAMGLGVSYDLGGGATASAGYSDKTTIGYGPDYEWDDRRWDAGVTFSF